MKKLNYYSCLLLCFSLIIQTAKAQSTIGVQDFESSPATPTLTYTGGSQSSGNGSYPTDPMYVSGSNGRQVNNASTEIEFASVNSSSYSNAYFTIRLASFSGTSGNGADVADKVVVLVSNDNGSTWSEELEITGNANAKWSFSSGTGEASIAYDGDNTVSSFAPSGGGVRTTDGYSTLKVTGLPSVANLKVKLQLTNNDAAEFWVVDDAYIYGINAPDNPGSFSASTNSITQIDLTWTQNASSDDVMVAYNTTNTFGDPVDGNAYSVSSTIAGGGTIIYNGSGTTYSHTGLDGGKSYFYKAFSVDGSTNYSSGLSESQSTTSAFPLFIDFETSGGYTSSITEFTDSDADFFFRTDGSTDISSSYQLSGSRGSYFFAAQDIDGEGATLPVTLNIEDISITGYTNLSFSIYLAEDDDGVNEDWDADDEFKIDYQIDGGGFNNLIHVQSSGGTNTEPAIDTDFDGVGDGTLITSTFTEHTASISGTGNKLDIRITFDLDAGDEDIAVDDIKVSGDHASAALQFTGSGSWGTTGANWSGSGAPTSTDDVIIPNGKSVTIGTDADCKNIVINNGGTLTINGGSSAGSLEIASGGQITNNGTLIIESDADGTGALLDNGNISNNGTIKVERYISQNAYHFISSPVNNGTAAMAGNINNLYPWSESSKSWGAKETGTLTNAQGYAYYKNSNETREWTGSLNTGTITIAASNTDGNTSSSRDNDEGWQLVGNPYPSPISISGFTTENSSVIDGTVYIFDHYDNSSYGSGYNTQDYLATNGSGSVTSRQNGGGVTVSNIGIGQGFFVRTKYGQNGQDISFTNSMRNVTSTDFYAGEKQNIQRLKLGIEDEKHNYNQILVAIMEDATDGFDNSYDGYKLRGNKDLSFYSFIDGESEGFVIQGISPVTASKTIPLGIDAGVGGVYKFSVYTFENIDPETNIYLEDLHKNKVINLRNQQVYEATLTSGKHNNRFILHFNSKANDVRNDLELENLIYSYGNSIYLNFENECIIQVFDILGKRVLQQTLTNNGLKKVDIPHANGYYIVEVKTSSQSYTNKVFLN